MVQTACAGQMMSCFFFRGFFTFLFGFFYRSDRVRLSFDVCQQEAALAMFRSILGLFVPLVKLTN